MVAAFKGKNNNEDDIAESDIDSITQEESEELFPDQGDELDKMEVGASFEVNNFDICEKITKKHLSVGSVQVALYIRCNWL